MADAPKYGSFTCAACKGTFDCEWSDEEADAEYRALFPHAAASKAPREVVCDDCFKKMTTAMPPKEWDRS
jgi:hypothetical protein